MVELLMSCLKEKKPMIAFFKVFGCTCYILNQRDSLNKFESKANKGYVVGYSSHSKTFRVCHKGRKTIDESSNVTFDEKIHDTPQSTMEEINHFNFDDCIQCRLKFKLKHQLLQK